MRLFIQSINEDFNLYKEYKKSKIKVFLDITFYIVLIYRMSNLLSRYHIPVLPRIFWLFNRILFSVDIDQRAQIGPGFRIAHGASLVIGHKVISKGKLTVYQGVTLGGNNWHSKEYDNQIIEQPFIYENVIIYANAIIVGPVVIKKNSFITAQAFIKE